MSLSVVMLNFSRRANVEQILKGHDDNPNVTEVLVWNNAHEIFAHKSPKVVWVNACQNFGLFPRYAMALLATNDYVMIQDDDLEIPAATVNSLLQCVENHKQIIHGLFGRIPKEDNTYADFRDKDNCYVEMVLGRCMVFHKSLAAHFFRMMILEANKFKKLFQVAKTLGVLESSVDDILFSYAAMTQSRHQNAVYPFPRTELAGAAGLCDTNNHFRYRNSAMQSCQKIFELWLKK
jgi:hypothetical protein